jgi:putative lipoprotein
MAPPQSCCFLAAGREQEEDMVLSGIEQFIVFGFMPLMIGMFAGVRRWRAVEPSVAGRMIIPPSDPLPANAVAIVDLVELRRGETVSPAVARETLDWRGGGIQNFTVRFDRKAIDRLAFYGLSARIVADGAVLFETRHVEPAAPLSGDPLTLMLTPTA